GISDICWSCDSRYIASASDDTMSKIWDSITGKCLITLKGHESFVMCCVFNSFTNLLLTGSYDETVRIWDIRHGKCIKILNCHTESITSIDITYDNTLLVTSSLDGLRNLDEQIYPSSHIKFTPNAKYLLQSSLCKYLLFLIISTIKLWDYLKGNIVKLYRGHQNEKFCIPSLFYGDDFVISGSEDNKMYVWDLQSQNITQTLSDHNDIVLSCSASKSLGMIASSSIKKDPSIIVYKLETLA
ncbi:hypothetical protein MXB_4051, partial [Myxobolus squamalis]